MNTARVLSLSLGLLCALCAPALSLDADRGAWRFPTASLDADRGARRFPTASSIVRNGWTIPGERRRNFTDRWFAPKKATLIRYATEGDVYDVVFLADAYAKGYEYYHYNDQRWSVWFKAQRHSVRQNRDKAEALYSDLLTTMAAEPALRNTLALTRFGRLRQAQGKHGEARELFLRAAQAGDPRGMTLYANAMRAAGEPASTWRPWYERAARDPVYPNREAALRLARLLVDEARFDEARELYDGLRTPHHLMQRGRRALWALVAYLEVQLEVNLRRRVAQPNADPSLRVALARLVRKHPEAGILRYPLEQEEDEFLSLSDRAPAIATVQAWEGGGEDRLSAERRWIAEAASSGNAQAQFLQALRLQVDRDDLQPAAHALLRRAAAQGHQGAIERLRQFEERLRVEKASLRQRLDGISGMLGD